MALNRGNGAKKKEYTPFWDQFSSGNLQNGREINPVRMALRVAGIYILLGIPYILLSDRFLENIIHDKHTLMLVGMVKGWVFVFLSGAIIFFLTYSAVRRIRNDELEIISGYEELAATYEELETTHEELATSEEELRHQYFSMVESQKLLLESEERYRLISEATNDGIWDEREDRVYFSDRWYEITGYTREEIESMEDWKTLIHPDDYERVITTQREHRKSKTSHYHCEYRLRRKDGRYIWILARGKALFDRKGNVYRMAGSHSDITKLKEYQQELQYIAYHDKLTGLPNRQALYKKNEDLILSEENSKFALLFIDADNFKFINDTMGHDFGDQLLQKLSERIKIFLKETCILYRLSGDEFIIIYRNIQGAEDVKIFAGQILAGLKEPFRVGESVLYINISIGISLYPEHGRNTNELLRCADIAMFRAKETGRNRYVVYAQPMNEIVAERVLIEEQLRSALDNNEFELFYQPQLNIKENSISGFEALLRWNSRELGLVSPLKFIKIAEETHLIIPLGEWVLKEACAFIKKLHLQGQTGLEISVNISMLQLLQNDFADRVLAILNSYGLDPACLELEITESILMESFEAIEGKLKKLCDRGVRIALDDFGKGYSSLSYLKQLPISTLKIDKSFIDSISPAEKGNKSLTGQIIILGRSMGLCVVAEGVETQEQLDYLIRRRCHKIQGYLFSKPLPEKEAEFLALSGKFQK